MPPCSVECGKKRLFTSIVRSQTFLKVACTPVASWLAVKQDLYYGIHVYSLCALIVCWPLFGSLYRWQLSRQIFEYQICFTKDSTIMLCLCRWIKCSLNSNWSSHIKCNAKCVLPLNYTIPFDQVNMFIYLKSSSSSPNESMARIVRGPTTSWGLFIFLQCDLQTNE